MDGDCLFEGGEGVFGGGVAGAMQCILSEAEIACCGTDEDAGLLIGLHCYGNDSFSLQKSHKVLVFLAFDARQGQHKEQKI